MTNTLCQGKDSNGKVAPMGATTTSSGDPAGLFVQADIPAFPTQSPISGVSVAGTTDNDILYTSPDVLTKNVHYIQNNSGESADIQVSLDGVTFTGPVALELVAATPIIATTEIARLQGIFKHIRIDQAGAGAPAAGEILITHGVE